MTAALEALEAQSQLYAGNAAFLEALYERYLRDPASLDPRWRSWFDRLQAGAPPEAIRAPAPPRVEPAPRPAPSPVPPPPAPAAAPAAEQAVRASAEKQAAVLRLINAYRFLGHRAADVDPLRLREREPVPELDPAHHGLTEADLDTVFHTGSLAAPDRMRLRDILALLRRVYCGTVGVEYMHITDTEQKRWIQARVEGRPEGTALDPEARRRLLERLVAAEGLERYLHTKYVGQKRFSLEGGDSLIPLLDRVIRRAGAAGMQEIVIGMAHRGRLNVLVNILGKSPQELFQEFEGTYDPAAHPGSGDVKYHMGFSSDVRTEGGTVHLALAFNPSHLEIVGPVVEGSARARQQRRGDRGGAQVMPVLLHGDAAFAGQGVVMENFQLSKARGFTTGGTLHVVVNNQIGFTTSNPLDVRSSYYCTDVAKIVEAPIFHVNGDDPEAVVFVAGLALDFRMRFRKDVVVDLVCYRRHGHNEADEPAATQPVMYRKIRAHPTVTRLYAERLAREGVVPGPEVVEALFERYRERIERGEVVAPDIVRGAVNPYAVDWSRYRGRRWTAPADTAVPVATLQELHARLERLPEGFELHPRVARILEDRRKMAAGALPLDWGFAETMAYATLLRQGHPVRLSGQDSGRGTFFHRHAVLHNQRDGTSWVPLQHLGEQANFVVIDSILSEEAVLAFEYGYATAEPEALVIWEAQFGDFANVAQVVIDQFISSGEAKWGRLCGLTLFLPHGYEGQGPEHSSARLERWLQLCAEHNLQVCVPTTPAQMFHLLRRQVLRPYRKPLVVLTPKSLLRHKRSVSRLEDLAGGGFRPVIPEPEALDPGGVRRVVCCTGKVCYDLLEARQSAGRTDVAIVRIEQLYPFPEEDLAAALAPWEKARELVWCQEEPENQGAWYQIRHRLEAARRKGQRLRYAGRAASAAPATGHFRLHLEQQKQLVKEALG